MQKSDSGNSEKIKFSSVDPTDKCKIRQTCAKNLKFYRRISVNKCRKSVKMLASLRQFRIFHRWSNILLIVTLSACITYPINVGLRTSKKALSILNCRSFLLNVLLMDSKPHFYSYLKIASTVILDFQPICTYLSARKPGGGDFGFGMKIDSEIQIEQIERDRAN